MNRLLILPVLILTLLVGTPAFSADFRNCEREYKNKNYDIAIRLCRPFAEQGNPNAQHKMGYMYADGLGVTENDKTAVKWFRLAAGQGYADAQYNLGVMYAEGEGVPQNYKTAVKWYRLAAEQGDADAQKNMKWIKSRVVSKAIEDCLFDEIKKVTGPETKKIVEKYCRNKLEKKSLDWLLRYAD